MSQDILIILCVACMLVGAVLGFILSVILRTMSEGSVNKPFAILKTACPRCKDQQNFRYIGDNIWRCMDCDCPINHSAR